MAVSITHLLMSFLSSAGWLTVSAGVKVLGLLGKEILFEKEWGAGRL